MRNTSELACSYPNSNKCLMHKDVKQSVIWFYALVGPSLALLLASIIPIGTENISIFGYLQKAQSEGVTFIIYGICAILFLVSSISTLQQKFLSSGHYFWFSFGLPVTLIRLIQTLFEKAVL